MSHVVSSAALVTDLACLKETVRKYFPMLEWVEGKTRFAWFGERIGDYTEADAADRNGIPADQWGTCDHVLRMKDINYEIGVTKRRDGKGYSLCWDFYADGINLSNCIGTGAEKLMVRYNQTYVERFAEAEGLEIETTTNNAGELIMELTAKGGY